ncbi:ribbon-helix-helix domain-containing protein [Sphingobium sp. CR2-8]|uniref:ribbon-helix-helix domain-containing protein n=1 Tax=Sphingobium sp. CR2-8 TaxID=1306534 RepID=UPI002DB85978|nr:ribbon-helix-helix domain-containing protein [Sphingobium sp. CR2-8]MEC3910346.1 ribbon-helix-helix domain-containing protein [Sphingobium sp. CR2-8]
MRQGDPDDGPSGPEGSPFAPPIKRSVTIAGHQTAISLEPIFWDALRAQAAHRHLPLNALVARIDAARLAATQPPNLASAIRSWLFQQQICDKGNN